MGLARTLLRALAVVAFAASSTTGKADNLSTCLSGAYPVLCNKAQLTPEQRKQAEAAERAHNLTTCVQGRYPALCNHALLAPDEAQRVRDAEHRANFETCSGGRYPALCNHSLLTPDELIRVDQAERQANLSTCRNGRYPALCNHSRLTSDQADQVRAAEQNASKLMPQMQVQAQLPRRYRGYGAGSPCESGHWIDEVLADGEIVKLEDGSLWRVDDVDTVTSSIWLPMTEIVVCEGKLINTDDNESVEAERIR